MLNYDSAIARNIIEYLNSIDKHPKDLIDEELLHFDITIQNNEGSQSYICIDHTDNTFISLNSNGLSWIYSLLVSIFSNLWQDISELDSWIKYLLSTFEIDRHFSPIRDIYLYGVELTINNSKSFDYNLIGFLNDNKYLIYILCLNILKFSIENYSNSAISNKKYVPLESCIKFDNTTKKIDSINGQLRNFILSIMGLEKVIIYQNTPNFVNYLLDSNFEDVYSTIEIEASTSINSGNIIKSVILFEHDSCNYDVVLNKNLDKQKIIQRHVSAY